jgi:hypothetical protein
MSEEDGRAQPLARSGARELMDVFCSQGTSCPRSKIIPQIEEGLLMLTLMHDARRVALGGALPQLHSNLALLLLK